MLFFACLSDYSLNKEILFILNISSLLLDLLPTPLLIWDGFSEKKNCGLRKHALHSLKFSECTFYTLLIL